MFFMSNTERNQCEISNFEKNEFKKKTQEIS